MEQKGRVKVETLLSLERDVQRRWQRERTFEVDAVEGKEKFFVTFPYPYMNGRLHLGHAFTLSKCEFAAGYQRMLGKTVLFPLGFHCTGMPIKACADKLKREFELYGNPPVFPVFETTDTAQDSPTKSVDKSKSKKSKAVAKTGGAKYQYNIMQSIGVPDDEIARFAAPEHWFEYFTSRCQRDCSQIGFRIDWRRSFLTTDVNPFYDSFVRWQFARLKDAGDKIDFGKRYTVYSPLDGQPCMDHDRSSGEGVGPMEYTIIKMRVLEPKPEKLKHIKEPIYFVAGTLRPETMYGQTNCWLGPDIKYIAFAARNNEVFVSVPRAARNMAYQGLTHQEGQVETLASMLGSDLFGTRLQSPLVERPIYTLPMFCVLDSKGTGVVTSVPSDAPDDYAALKDLKTKKPLREKYGIKDEMVLPYEPVPIIEVPGFGKLSAVSVCESDDPKQKVTSQNDREKLQIAKDKVYKAGFYEGVLLVGEFSGQKVQDVKKIIRDQLISKNEAAIYMEPEGPVMSRSGDECVVALCDQWYLKYGEDAWKRTTLSALGRLDTFHDEVRHNFNATFDWLHEHACSRSYGLGSKMPWDEQYLIESLSDSTIYMAYYTVAHLLHTDWYGKELGDAQIRPEQLTNPVWDYIFFRGKLAPSYAELKTTVPQETLDRLRSEFDFWYPVDLRCSGKDLVQNHLTYYLYNHTAMWPSNPDQWPRAIRANGHLLLNNDKMSKSIGNFLTMTEAVQKYSADGVRLALADAGDSIEDANFMENMADAGVLRLYNLLEWVQESVSRLDKMRDSRPTFHDQLFEWEWTYSCGMHRSLVARYLRVQALLLAPVCPHVAEKMWSLAGHKDSIMHAHWPQSSHVDRRLLDCGDYLQDAVYEFRARLKAHMTPKGKKAAGEPPVKPTHATLFIAKEYPPWQSAILRKMKELYSDNNNVLPENKQISQAMGGIADLKPHMKKVMPFVQTIKEAAVKVGAERALSLTSYVNEAETLRNSREYIENTLELECVRIRDSHAPESDDRIREACSPGKPFVTFSHQDGVPLRVVNVQVGSSLFEVTVPIYPGDGVEDLQSRVLKAAHGGHVVDLCVSYVQFYRYKDPQLGPRKLPSVDAIVEHMERIHSDCRFDVDAGSIFLQDNGHKHSVGSQLTYRVLPFT